MASLRPPSFFKVLLNPSLDHLPLPPDFVSRHLKNKIPENPILRSADGQHSWQIKMKKMGDFYCFSHGWIDVAKDALLDFGDFLVFSLVDESTFKMLIYSPDGCEKHLPPNVQIENGGEDIHVDDDDGDPSFPLIISGTHINMLRLPAEFNGLPGIEAGGTIRVMNVEGKEWEMQVRLETSYRSRGRERYYLTYGWRDFRRSNDLSEGDECVFKFVRSEGTILLAKHTKKPDRKQR